MCRVWSAYGGYALGFVSLFVIWHLAAVYLVGSVLFPPPAVVFRKAWTLALSGVLWEHLWASLQRILAGFIAGSALGFNQATRAKEEAPAPAPSVPVPAPAPAAPGSADASVLGGMERAPAPQPRAAKKSSRGFNRSWL